MTAEELKGHLDGLVLAVLAGEPKHGYAVIKALRRRSGMLASDWSDSGRRRRVYRLTAKGEKELGVRRARWREFATTVDAVLA